MGPPELGDTFLCPGVPASVMCWREPLRKQLQEESEAGECWSPSIASGLTLSRTVLGHPGHRVTTVSSSERDKRVRS